MNELDTMNEMEKIELKHSIAQTIIMNPEISQASPLKKLLIEKLVMRLPVGMSQHLNYLSGSQIIELAMGMSTYSDKDVEQIHKSGYLTWVEAVMELMIFDDACPFQNSYECNQYENCESCLIENMSKQRMQPSLYLVFHTTPVFDTGLNELLNAGLKKNISPQIECKKSK